MRLSNIILAATLLAFSCAMSAQVIPGLGGVAGPTSSIIGQIQTATGGTINNGALTFTLSQPAVVSGSASIVTQQSSCYTSTNGNIVGIPDPLALPILSTNTASGTLPAGTYYVKIHYVGGNGVSVVSAEASIVLSAQGTVIVSPPLIQPSPATGYGVSIGSATQTETIQGVVTGWSSFSKSVPLVAGSSPPATNTSTCNVYFSDQLIPTGTNYIVNLLNKNGSQVAGFPQTWCTYGGAGATINVSQGAPTGNCNTSGVFYPTPIFANPQNGASQAITGILTGTNFNLTTPTLRNPSIVGGICNNNPGCKQIRVAIPNIAPTAQATITLIWATPFPDTNYTVVAVTFDPGNGLRVRSIVGVTTGTVSVNIDNTDGVLTHSGTLEVIAMHD